ncbi:TM2 domain-containing protein [Parabacteroides segnis]|uniref:TM2 domain-containing protein n=1 Tax=Parabacteroides segnis TaxID=2763058 RepID=UPI0035141DDC
MEADKVDKFLLANESKFPDYEIPIHKLLNLPPEKETLLENTHFRSPGIILLLSIFLGVTGLDRFLIGNIGKGFGKLLTAGGLGIWYIVDWFLITGATKRYNMNKLMAILS